MPSHLALAHYEQVTVLKAQAALLFAEKEKDRPLDWSCTRKLKVDMVRLTNYMKREEKMSYGKLEVYVNDLYDTIAFHGGKR